MRPTVNSSLWWGAGFGLVLAVALFLGQTGSSRTAANEPPQLNIDNAPLNEEIKRATSYAPIVKKVAPSVVNVYTSKRIRLQEHPFLRDPFFRRFFGIPEGEGRGSRPPSRVEQSLGSGVIVSEDGYILTNNHVVEGADEIKIGLSNSDKRYDARVVGKDPQTDIAVLKIEATGLPAITITDSDQLEVGDTVLAIGNPFGVGQTVTSGIVGATGRAGFGIVQYEDFIQTDASINPGNSGGALVDAQGRLVGINTFIISRTGGSQGIGFAVPINMIRGVLDLLVREGKVTRGYLGVTLQDEIGSDLAQVLELPDQRGALVTSVQDGTPAEKAGLKPGDVIIEFGGKSVADRRALQFMVAQMTPGAKTSVKIIRNGKEQTLDVTLAEFPAGGPGAPSLAPVPEDEDALWGVQVTDLTPQSRRELNIPSSIQGALVTNVDPESPAFEAGIRPGTVVLEINREPVRNADDAVRLSRTTREKNIVRIWAEGVSRYVTVASGRGGR